MKYVTQKEVLERAKNITGMFTTYTCMHPKCDKTWEAFTTKEIKKTFPFVKRHASIGKNHVIVRTVTKITVVEFHD